MEKFHTKTRNNITKYYYLYKALNIINIILELAKKKVTLILLIILIDFNGLNLFLFNKFIMIQKNNIINIIVIFIYTVNLLFIFIIIFHIILYKKISILLKAII